MAVNNHRDNLNSLYCHPDLILSVDRALWNIIVSAYTHYIDTWAMNGACVGHRTVLMRSMLMFAMHLDRYRCRECHFTKEHKKKGLPPSMPLPAIDVTTRLNDPEENLKLEQIRGTHPGILDLLGDSGSPLYAKPLSMAEHFDAMLVGTHHIGDLPKCGHCRDPKVAACLYEDEAKQACQQILRCLDMRVLDGDLIVPTCLCTPTLILPPRHFIQMYYDPDIQGCYASQFPSGGQGFLQPRGDIRASIVPRDFKALPIDVQEAVNAYFHREELEDWVEKDPDEDQDMSTDTEAAGTVRRLQVGDPTALASLQEAVHDTLMPAMAP